MTEGKSTPGATCSGPIAQEIAEWLREIRSRWTAPLSKPLSVELQNFFAFAGSFTWMIGFVFTIRAHPILASLQTAGVTLGIFGVLGVMTFFSFWFGFLVAFSRRKASPVRLFLDGLLLPTVTVSIIAFAMGRIVQIPADLPASSQSQETLSGDEGDGSEQPTDPAPNP